MDKLPIELQDTTTSSQPFFSVIIPTFNRARLIPRAINSVLTQTIQDFEIVIVDDASSDDTEDVVRAIGDPRIRYSRNKENLHKGGARNVGIQHATGRYICFLDDDDYYLRDHLETFHCFFRAHGYPHGFAFTMPMSEMQDGTVTQRFIAPIGDRHPVEYLFNHKTPVGAPYACISRSILQQMRFNTEIRIGQDTELFMRVAARYPVYRLEAFTVVGVRHDDNSGALKNNSGRERLRGYRHVFGNKEVSQHIPWKLKREMLAYCHHREAEHYQFVGNRLCVYSSLLKAILLAPWDDQLLNRFVTLLYNLPGGDAVRVCYQRLKRRWSSSPKDQISSRAQEASE